MGRQKTTGAFAIAGHIVRGLASEDVHQGDVVGVQTKHGLLDCVVVWKRQGQRGRSCGVFTYSLAPMTGKQGKAFGFTAKGEQFLRPAAKSWSKAEIDSATDAYLGARHEKEERKEDRREEREAKVIAMKPAVGDEVLIRFSDGARWREVRAVNEFNGKIGIDAANYAAKKERQDSVRRIALFVGNEDMANRIRDPRKFRWIDPRFVTAIRRVDKKTGVTTTETIAK